MCLNACPLVPESTAFACVLAAHRVQTDIYSLSCTAQCHCISAIDIALYTAADLKWVTHFKSAAA